MDRTCIECQRDGRIATVVLNRPDRLNAYTPQLGHELSATLAALDRDDDVRAIIVTGAGRAFCAGADLEAGGETFGDGRKWVGDEKIERAVQPSRMRTPIIAAINGAAVGIGATLPLWWDIRIASDNARIGFVFVRRGMSPEANSTWILPRLVGMSRAMEWLLTGRMIPAREALDAGLLSRVVPPHELMATARSIANDIAQNTSPLAVAATRKLVWRGVSEPSPAAHKTVEDDVFFWMGQQSQVREGIVSFFEKRAPAWPAVPWEELHSALRDSED